MKIGFNALLLIMVGCLGAILLISPLFQDYKPFEIILYIIAGIIGGLIGLEVAKKNDLI